MYLTAQCSSGLAWGKTASSVFVDSAKKRRKWLLWHKSPFSTPLHNWPFAIIILVNLAILGMSHSFPVKALPNRDQLLFELVLDDDRSRTYITEQMRIIRIEWYTLEIHTNFERIEPCGSRSMMTLAFPPIRSIDCRRVGIVESGVH
jgi:hypothetical protein